MDIGKLSALLCCGGSDKARFGAVDCNRIMSRMSLKDPRTAVEGCLGSIHAKEWCKSSSFSWSASTA